MSAFDQLSALLREKHLYATAAATLGWDQETFLPENGVPHRAAQLSLLAGKVHQLGSNDDYRRALEAAEEEALPEQAANLRELRHHFERTTRIPQQLVERDSETSSLAKAAWAKARRDNDFDAFAPHLENLLAIAREKADRWGYPDEPYTALLAGYERGTTTTEVVTLFDSLRNDLVAVAAEAVASSQHIPGDLLHGPAPIDKQQTLNREIAKSLGFDFTSGRIDTTTHPFCTTLGPKDVRLTTRYDENDFASSLFGVLHEAGHGLYEQGLPASEAHLPSGDSVSLGIHESQSRLWENHVGRSRPFWEKWLPRAQECFPHLRAIALDDFLAAINRSQYSFVRVEADEATYDLHILLRFELERQLLRGELAVKDVPEAWNSRFTELFGMTPENDAEGCLQDIHWSMGGLGYFPTYSLGNLNAAQLFHTARQEPAIASALAKADYQPLLAWLRETIHARGATLLPQDLMTTATGRPTEGSDYLAHLRQRFAQ
ncbi:carboxypeptidase M32 [Roseibacillus ishigakijimensis]|uniref:Metal-dependent carboxypeptidase n=1 Tax=Roseibacillus ishigakijimensis TaxID=454146 RepID=A0A934VJX5_9BACT|nr:carboxypeptidase M32 [Roseibacillus ishigakijimensis]MBK1833059.1 carboxypeptidase M32 [Roseibacillus ishigakijimensis]